MANDARNFGAKTGNMRRLLVKTAENAAALPDVAMERNRLETELAAAEEAKNRQDTHKAEKQRATKEMNEALTRAKDAAIQLQNAAKFKLGARSEILVAFQVAPQRKRGPRKGSQAKKQEAALQKLEAQLAKKEEELNNRKQLAMLLRQEVERLKKEEEAAQAS